MEGWYAEISRDGILEKFREDDILEILRREYHRDARERASGRSSAKQSEEQPDGAVCWFNN